MLNTRDAATITREELEALPQGKLRDYMPDFINIFRKGFAEGNPDYSRLQLRNEFHQRAYGRDKIVMPISQNEWRHIIRERGDWVGPQTTTP